MTYSICVKGNFQMQFTLQRSMHAVSQPLFFCSGYPRKLPMKCHWIWPSSFRFFLELFFKAKQEINNFVVVVGQFHALLNFFKSCNEFGLVVSEWSCFIKQNNKWAILLLLINPNALLYFWWKVNPRKQLLTRQWTDGRMGWRQTKTY